MKSVIVTNMNTTTARKWVRAYAVLAVIVGFITAIAGFAFLFGGAPLAGIFQPVDFGTTALFAAGTAAMITGAIMLLLALFYFAVAAGLWNFRPWARMAALILSVISLLNFPLGTIIGLIGIWLFGFSDAKMLFGAGYRTSRTNAVAGRRL